MPSAMARWMALAQKRSRFTSKDRGSPEALDYTWDWRNRLASAERSGEGIAILGYDHTRPHGIQLQSPENVGRRPVERHQLSSGLRLPRVGWRAALAALR